MSPIYGAAFLWLIAAILWWSGWREETSEDVPDWAAGVFLAVWPLAALGKLVITPSLSVNGAWLWTLVSIAALAWRTPPVRRWTAASAGLLVGSVGILLGRLALMPASFAQDIPPVATAAFAGLLVALLLRPASEQTIAISVSLYVCEAVFALADASGGGAPETREAYWLEGWWTAALTARAWTFAARRTGEWTRKWADRFAEKRGGQRS